MCSLLAQAGIKGLAKVGNADAVSYIAVILAVGAVQDAELHTERRPAYPCVQWVPRAVKSHDTSLADTFTYVTNRLIGKNLDHRVKRRHG